MDFQLTTETDIWQSNTIETFQRALLSYGSVVLDEKNIFI
jgi:hypothetical protein